MTGVENMFSVNGYTIDLHRGDTGTIGITATGYTFGPDDRAVFTVKDLYGNVVKQGIYALDNNRFEVAFANGDTDQLETGLYEWDVRYVVNPVYDENDNIISGDAVATPKDPMDLRLRRTVGKI